MQPQTLRPTSWLAKRLGVSISTIERLRMAGSPDLPSAILIGKSIRYNESVVEQWLCDRQKNHTVTTPNQTGGCHDELAA